MRRLILRALNAPGLVLLTLFGIVLQTSLFQSWPLLYLQPDAVLLVVIWCALRRNFTEGGFLTLIVANIAEVHSAAPQGLYLIAYMGVYLTIRGASKILVIPTAGPYTMITLVASILWKLTSLGVLHFLGVGANQWRHTFILLFPGAFVEAAAAIWVFRWLAIFDRATFKTSFAEKALEDDLQLEGEGF